MAKNAAGVKKGQRDCGTVGEICRSFRRLRSVYLAKRENYLFPKTQNYDNDRAVRKIIKT